MSQSTLARFGLFRVAGLQVFTSNLLPFKICRHKRSKRSSKGSLTLNAEASAFKAVRWAPVASLARSNKDDTLRAWSSSCCTFDSTVATRLKASWTDDNANKTTYTGDWQFYDMSKVYKSISLTIKEASWTLAELSLIDKPDKPFYAHIPYIIKACFREGRW